MLIDIFYWVLWSTLSFFVARTDCWLCPAPASALSMNTQLHTHTHSSAQLRQRQCSSISTYLYKLLIAEIPCIVVCSLHARCLRIIFKLPIAEIHSITVFSLHARRNWDTLTVCSLMVAGRAVFILIIAQAQTPLINNSAARTPQTYWLFLNMYDGGSGRVIRHNMDRRASVSLIGSPYYTTADRGRVVGRPW